LFTTDEARSKGVTMATLRWGDAKGRWRRVRRGVYGVGPDEPDALDRARAEVLARCGVAGGHLAGVLLELDNVVLNGRPMQRRSLPRNRVITAGGVPCACGLQTLRDLAATLNDLVWEQALESALRKDLTTITDIERELEAMSRSRTPGVARMRRVLALRPSGCRPTESLLETLMVQLARKIPGLPEPIRQHDVYDRHGTFVARVDLAWPELGLFIELDGQQHKGQPVYDARRETAVVAATGWLCGRFTWREVVRLPVATGRRLAEVAEQARRRPPAA
jgi:hypothetical protein